MNEFNDLDLGLKIILCGAAIPLLAIVYLVITKVPVFICQWLFKKDKRK